MYSFQAWMKPKMAVATSPGPISGSTIRTNASSRRQPSIMAASSSSAGMLAMKPRSVQTMKGRTTAM